MKVSVFYSVSVHLFCIDVSPIPDPFDLTGMDDGPKGPITEPVSSSVIEEEPKEPITERVSSPVEPSDSQAANQTSGMNVIHVSTNVAESVCKPFDTPITFFCNKDPWIFELREIF